MRLTSTVKRAGEIPCEVQHASAESSPAQRLCNWFALLALLAVGIVWPADEQTLADTTASERSQTSPGLSGELFTWQTASDQ